VPKPRRRLWIVVAGAIALTALFSCCIGWHRANRQTFDQPVPDPAPFASAEPSNDELARFEAAAAYAEQAGGFALLVLRGDEVVFESYHNGYKPDAPHHLYSGTKSFSCALAAAAIADGILRLDEPVADTLPELRADPRKARITVEQLLDFSSGLETAFRDLTLDGLLKPERQRVPDKYARSLELGLSSDPGARFIYGSSHLMVFGALMKAKLGSSPLAYLQHRVLDRIGFRYAGWAHDTSGNPALPYGAWTTARQWARFGVLLRDDGRFEGNEILPPGLLARCRRPSPAMAGYGLTLWLNAPMDPSTDTSGVPKRLMRMRGSERQLLDPGGPEDLFAAAGFDGQRLYVVPSANLVVVRFGAEDRTFRDCDFLGLLLRGVSGCVPR